MPPSQASSRRVSFDVAATVALIVTLVLAAIIVLPGTSLPFIATKTFVLGIGAIISLALYILARLSRGNIVFPPLLLVAALWLPTLAYALSALFAGSSFSFATFGTALDSDTFGFVLVLAVLGTLTAFSFRRINDVRLFFTWLGYALAFVVLAGILALVVGQFAPNTIAPSFALVGSLQDLAALAGLGLVLSLVALREFALSSRARLWLLVLGLLELVILAVANLSLLWTFVGLVALALFVEAVMRRGTHLSEADLDGAAFLESEEESGAESQRSLVAPLVVLAAALFFLIGPSIGNALSTGLHTNVLDVRPSWQSTLATGSAVYKTSPFFGSGPDSFGSAWLLARNPSLNQTAFWNLDFTSGIGFIPTSIVSTGLIGALAWLLLFAAFIVFGLRALLLRAPEDAYARFALLAAFVGSVYLFALAIFSSPGPVPLALAFVFAGLFASLMRHARGALSTNLVFTRSPRVGFVIVFGLTLLLLASIAAAYTLVERYLAVVDLARASTALQAGNTDAAAADAAAALSFAPGADVYQAQAAIANAKLSQIAADTTLAPADAQKLFQSTLSDGINAALTATRLAPNDYQNWLALGNLYAAVVPLGVAGAHDNALASYQKAEALDPTSPTIPYLVAQLEIAAKNSSAAEAALKAAITLKQDYTQAIFLLSQLEVATGNIKDALAAAEAAAYFTPNDPSVLFQLGILRAAEGDSAGAISALSSAIAANPSFANARYYLAALYASEKDYQDALVQLNAIAALSDANKQAVASLIASLTAGKDPFPANLLSASSTPIQQ